VHKLCVKPLEFCSNGLIFAEILQKTITEDEYCSENKNLLFDDDGFFELTKLYAKWTKTEDT
jgi:hypothetical protein